MSRSGLFRFNTCNFERYIPSRSVRIEILVPPHTLIKSPFAARSSNINLGCKVIVRIYYAHHGVSNHAASIALCKQDASK